MAKQNLTAIVPKIVKLLTPLTPEERMRVMRSSLELLGQTGAGKGLGEDKDEGEGVGSLGVRAKSWIKQNSLSSDELQQVFHMTDGSMAVIAADIPGKGKKGKTLNAYVLVGVSKFLSTDDAKFDDKSARALCEGSGCYDSANHAQTLKAKGNWFTGTKEKGWSLTAPGLKQGAMIVKELNKQSG